MPLVGVETYGGGIWHSWFDRDLSLAGRVIVASPKSASTSAPKFSSRLIRIDRPILRIPTLAIHLERGVNDAFKFNNETEFIPILGLVSAELNQKKQAAADNDSSDSEKDSGPPAAIAKHHPALIELLAQELSVGPEEIHDFELCVLLFFPKTVS